MKSGSGRGSQFDSPRASQGSASAADDHQRLEAQLRRFPMRDRVLQLLDWLYPYSARRTRKGRGK